MHPIFGLCFVFNESVGKEEDIPSQDRMLIFTYDINFHPLGSFLFQAPKHQPQHRKMAEFHRFNHFRGEESILALMLRQLAYQPALNLPFICAPR